MAKISDYAKGRMRPNEQRIAKELVEDVKKSDLSQEFKEGFSISMSAKYQTLTLIVPTKGNTFKELGKFEYDVLGLWAEKNHVGWEWRDERDDYVVIDWSAN